MVTMIIVQCLKRIFFSCSIALFLSSVQTYTHKTPVKAVAAFTPGEWLQYQVYYSCNLFGKLMHAGTATMSVGEQLHKINDHLCYKVQVEGVSNGALANLLRFKVLDTWESYLDTEPSNGLRPHRCFTHLQENGYVREEKIDFDYQSNQAKVEVAESLHNMRPEINFHPVNQPDIKDLIGGYYALRSIDTKKLKPGDKLSITVLYEQKLYEDISILFLGKKTITTKLGKVSTLVFAPLIPMEGGIFSGERPVEAYISNDANKVPIKLSVNLVIGAVEIELTSYKGLKDPIRFH